VKDAGHAIDWQEAYARLERVRRALEAGAEPGPEEAAAIMRQRAQALARPTEVAEALAETQDALVFCRGEESYAVEMAHVADAAALRELTPVPGLPPFILGVVNHRGRIVAILDLRTLLVPSDAKPAPRGFVVMAEAGGKSFGILADSIKGATALAVDDLGPAPAGLGPGLVRGVTADMIAVVDLEAVARDPRIVVDERAG